MIKGIVRDIIQPVVSTIVGSSDVAPWTQLFDDTTTYMRKVVRMSGADEVYAVDLRLTDSPGFAGIEDTDFEMIYGNII